MCFLKQKERKLYEPSENISMDKFSGLGITSAFCSVPLSFVSLMRIYTAFLFSRFPQMYKISVIYSVNDSQETPETWNISRARDKYSEWLKQFI